MRKLFLFALILSIGSSTIAQTTNNATQGWLSYTDSTTGISVNYPSNWTLKTTNPKSPIVLKAPLENADDIFAENINYVVRVLPQGSKVLLTDFSSAITKTVDDFKLEYEKKVQWMGAEALEYEYSGIPKGDKTGLKIKLLQRITIVNSNMYLATYTAENGKVDMNKTTAIKIINLTTLKK